MPKQLTRRAAGASTTLASVRTHTAATHPHAICIPQHQVSSSAACRLYRADCDHTRVAQSPGASPPRDGASGTARLARLPRIGWDRSRRRASSIRSAGEEAPRVVGASTAHVQRAQAPHRTPRLGSRRMHHTAHHVRKHTWPTPTRTEQPVQQSRPPLEAVVYPTGAAAGRSPMGTPLPLILSRHCHTRITHKTREPAHAGKQARGARGGQR